MRRTFTYPHPFELECGEALPSLTIAYDTFGERRGDNVVWVCHALTANSDVADWWPGTVAEGRFLDPSRHFTVCANILGSPYGTTSPLSDNPSTGSPYYGTFPMVTTRDMARAHLLLADHLGIESAEAVIGSSIGGFQAVEMALLRPGFARRLVLIATAAAATPWLRAFNESQRMAIEADASFGEPRPDAAMAGLAAARSIALLSYRGGKAYNATQGETDGAERLGGYRALSYQRYQGEKLCRRFNAYSYHLLTRALDAHDAGRGRGGLRAALGRVAARTLTVAITSDLLFPPEEMAEMSGMIDGCRMEVIESAFGHDGFLVEADKLNALVKPFIEGEE